MGPLGPPLQRNQVGGIADCRLKQLPVWPQDASEVQLSAAIKNAVGNGRRLVFELNQQ